MYISITETRSYSVELDVRTGGCWLQRRGGRANDVARVDSKLIRSCGEHTMYWYTTHDYIQSNATYSIGY